MKRFLLFGWYDSDKAGGFSDFICSCNVFDEAMDEALKRFRLSLEAAGQKRLWYAQIVDVEVQEIVWECFVPVVVGGKP